MISLRLQALDFDAEVINKQLDQEEGNHPLSTRLGRWEEMQENHGKPSYACHMPHIWVEKPVFPIL